MSDVHGRKREKTTEELLKAKREREASKIKDYNQLVATCRSKMENKVYDQDTFNLTTKIVSWNPDYYTIWNYRRILIQHTCSNETDDLDKKQKTFIIELLLFLQLIKMNPKSYWLWNHRIWCLETMPKPDWHAELGLVDKMLTMDARNFHGWNYRRFVVDHLKKDAKNEQEIAQIIEQEFNFTTRKINQSFSNYSAWHQRSKLLPHIVSEMSEEERNQVAENELELVKAAIYTDPEDQSAWLYYWWLLGKTIDPVKLTHAYQVRDTPLIVFGFNDSIKIVHQEPHVYNEESEKLKGRLYSYSDEENSPIWFYLLDEKSIAKRIEIKSKTLLPSASAKHVPEDNVLEKEIQCMEKDNNTEQWIHALQQNTKQSWKLPSTKMYKDPTLVDQTAWFTLDKVQLLKQEIETVRELLELEPDSAWTLQTLVHFLNQLVLRSPESVDIDDLYKEMVGILDTLIEIDSDREHRYKDKKKDILLKQKLACLSNVETLDLRNVPSNYTPLL